MHTQREDKAEPPRVVSGYDGLWQTVKHMIVAKRPRVTRMSDSPPCVSASSRAREAPFDREAIHAKLFALPLPPGQWDRRQYPVHTPLGRVMRLKGMTIRDVERMDGCPNSRRMSDYLAGRREISTGHRGALARGLGVDVRLL